MSLFPFRFAAIDRRGFPSFGPAVGIADAFGPYGVPADDVGAGNLVPFAGLLGPIAGNVGDGALDQPIRVASADDPLQVLITRPHDQLDDEEAWRDAAAHFGLLPGTYPFAATGNDSSNAPPEYSNFVNALAPYLFDPSAQKQATTPSTSAAPPGFANFTESLAPYLLDPFAPMGLSPVDVSPVYRNSESHPYSAAEVADDIGKSTGIGLVKGTISIPGGPGDIGNTWFGLNYGLMDWLGPKIGLSKKSIDEMKQAVEAGRKHGLFYDLPTSSGIQSQVEKYTGKFYEPQTRAGHYFDTAASFVPAALMGASGETKLLTQIFKSGIVPGLASESAGQITHGTRLEPFARIIAPLLAGGRFTRVPRGTFGPAVSAEPGNQFSAPAPISTPIKFIYGPDGEAIRAVPVIPNQFGTPKQVIFGPDGNPITSSDNTNFIIPSEQAVKPASSVSSPAISRQLMFDDSPSALRDSYPVRAQFNLERLEPPPGPLPDYVQRVLDEKNMARVRELALPFIEKTSGHLNLNPIRQAAMAELGAQSGEELFEKLAKMTGATAIRTTPQRNARIASYYLYRLLNGNPLTRGSAPPEYPYGHFAQRSHMASSERIATEGTLSSTEGPKIASMPENMLGNFNPAMLDSRSNIMLDFVGPNGRLLLAPPRRYYGVTERGVQNLAAQEGVSPLNLHLALRAAYDLRNGRPMEPPFLRYFQDAAIRKAEQMGEPVPVVWRRFFRGEIPLLSLTGGLVAFPTTPPTQLSSSSENHPGQ